MSSTRELTTSEYGAATSNHSLAISLHLCHLIALVPSSLAHITLSMLANCHTGMFECTFMPLSVGAIAVSGPS